MDRKVLGWIVVAVALALSWRLSAEYLWILSFLPVAVWLIVGVVLVVVYLVKAWRSELRRRALAQSAWVFAGLALFMPLGSLGSRLTEIIRFRVQRAAYDHVVDKVVADPGGPGLRKADGLEYIVDEGPPIRVAFVWPGGVIDNWCGVVYDPIRPYWRSPQHEAQTLFGRVAHVTGHEALRRRPARLPKGGRCLLPLLLHIGPSGGRTRG